MRDSRRRQGMLGLAVLAVAVGLVGGLLEARTAWAVSCGDTLGPGGSFVLTGNLGPCATDPAVTVVGPVTFNLAGFTISCETTATNGVVVEGYRANVLNGTVRGCLDGVRLEGDGSHRITYIISRDHDDDGFDIRSSWNWLGYNEGNDNGDEGFQIYGNHNYLGFNKARRNNSDGYDNEPEEGGGNHNTFFKNLAEWNDEGFEIGGYNNVLKFNTAQYNNQGFLVESGASNNWLTFNTAFRNKFDGFDVDGDYNTLNYNLAVRNRGDGIDAEEGANNNRITDNFAVFNGENDLEDDNPNCDANQWINNAFNTSNQGCIH